MHNALILFINNICHSQIRCNCNWFLVFWYLVKIDFVLFYFYKLLITQIEIRTTIYINYLETKQYCTTFTCSITKNIMSLLKCYERFNRFGHLKYIQSRSKIQRTAISAKLITAKLTLTVTQQYVKFIYLLLNSYYDFNFYCHNIYYNNWLIIVETDMTFL